MQISSSPPAYDFCCPRVPPVKMARAMVLICREPLFTTGTDTESTSQWLVIAPSEGKWDRGHRSFDSHFEAFVIVVAKVHNVRSVDQPSAKLSGRNHPVTVYQLVGGR
jgi:hypothetical protein